MRGAKENLQKAFVMNDVESAAPKTGELSSNLWTSAASASLFS
jgi:hypothetical protein